MGDLKCVRCEKKLYPYSEGSVKCLDCNLIYNKELIEIHENRQKNCALKLIEQLSQTLNSIMLFADSLIEEAKDGRLSPVEYDLGFNLKTCILLYEGRKIKEKNP